MSEDKNNKNNKNKQLILVVGRPYVQALFDKNYPARVINPAVFCDLSRRDDDYEMRDATKPKSGKNSVSFWDVVGSFVSNGYFAERGFAETNEMEQQIIPYCTITTNKLVDGRWVPHVLTYQRHAGDSRLVGNTSIGFGGHIEEQDNGSHNVGNGFDFSSLNNYGLTVVNNVVRELVEEISFTSTGLVKLFDRTFGLYGFVYEHETPVGRVHLGIALNFAVKEEDINLSGISDENKSGKNLYWSDIYTLKESVDNGSLVMERWSQLVLEEIHRLEAEIR